MKEIDKIIGCILKPDYNSMKKAENRQNNLLKPKGSLGKLESITIKLAGIYRTDDIPDIKKAVITFASDNGVYDEGVSKDIQSLTAMHFPNFLKNYSAIGSICEYTGTKLIAIDVGINSDKILHGVIDEKIAYGTKNMCNEASMSEKQAIQAIKIGIKYADKMIKEGYNMIFLGEMGIANTTPATAIISLITGISPEEITGRGSGIDDERLKNKIYSIKKSLLYNKPDKTNYIDILSKIGGFEIGSMIGVILACSSRNVPVILDGLITYSALLLSHIACKDTIDYVIFSHTPKEKAGKYALKYLDVVPPLDLKLCLGEGYGAVLYSNIIESAVYSYKKMKTFKEVNMKV